MAARADFLIDLEAALQLGPVKATKWAFPRAIDFPWMLDLASSLRAAGEGHDRHKA
jgi:hypothetical protein